MLASISYLVIGRFFSSLIIGPKLLNLIKNFWCNFFWISSHIEITNTVT